MAMGYSLAVIMIPVNIVIGQPVVTILPLLAAARIYMTRAGLAFVWRLILEDAHTSQSTGRDPRYWSVTSRRSTNCTNCSATSNDPNADTNCYSNWG